MIDVSIQTPTDIYSAKISIEDFQQLPTHPELLSMEAFVPMQSPEGKHVGDVKVFGYIEDGKITFEILTLNGHLSNFVNKIEGQLKVAVEGQIITDTPIVLYDGTGYVSRSGKLKYNIRDDVRKWYIRHAPEKDETLMNHLATLKKPVPDTAYTGTTGSPRNIAGEWSLAVAAFLQENPNPVYTEWMHEWVDQQFQRPLHFYDSEGDNYRALKYPSSIIGQAGIWNGWSSKETFGRYKDGKDLVEHPPQWNTFDHQHFEVDRLLLTYAITGSQTASFAAQAVLEGGLSYPGYKTIKSVDTAREMGWTLRAYTLAFKVYGKFLPQYKLAITNILGDLHASQGIQTGWPYPCLGPADKKHIYPSLEQAKQWFAFQPALEWNDSWTDVDKDVHPYLMAKGKEIGSQYVYWFDLTSYFESVPPWQVSFLIRALADIKEASFLWLENVHDDLVFTTACVMYGGKKNNWFVADYAPKSHTQLEYPTNSPNGTISWMVVALVTADDHLSGHAELMADAKTLYDGSEYSKLSHPQGNVLSIYGLRTLKKLGVKA